MSAEGDGFERARRLHPSTLAFSFVGHVRGLIVPLVLVLFFASQMGGHFKRTLRHPQMIGTVIWATSHLLTNGDSRSLILFGSLAVWSVLEIVLSNRRDGPRTELPAAALKFDVIAIVVGAVAWALLGHFHVNLFGVASL